LTAHAVPDNIIDGTKKIAPANIVLFLLVPGGVYKSVELLELYAMIFDSHADLVVHVYI